MARLLEYSTGKLPGILIFVAEKAALAKVKMDNADTTSVTVIILVFGSDSPIQGLLMLPT